MALKVAKKEAKQAVDHEISVDHVRSWNDVIFFNLTVNGVTIYGCRYLTYQDKQSGEERGFVGFPSRGADDGKYYNHAYVRLSDADIAKIEAQIDEQLK